MRKLIAILFLLAIGAGSYWFSYRKTHQTETAPKQITQSVETVSTPTPNTSAQTLPYREHVVAAGETLYSISKQYDLMWSTVADYNGLTENSVLRVGSTLKIPLNANGQITRKDNQALPDAATIGQIEQGVKLGQDTWRTDPVATVRHSAPVDYHLKNDDIFTVTELDNTAGTATIEVTHDDRSIIFHLTQPTAKGKGGIWFINMIETQ